MHRPSSRNTALILSLAMCVLLPRAGAAQYFGKNKVQYDEYDWSVLETDNFHVFFYREEEEVAADAARMAERAYAKLSKLLDHEVREPIPLILYASHTDFQQTNALQGLISEGTGGVTEFFKRRVVLPFTGSYAEFDHVLTHELVHAFQLDILLGPDKRSIGSRLANTPPLWFMEGMSEYLSIGEVDEHTKMWLRDASLEGYLISIPELSMTGDIRVYRFGQSILEFIAERYGLPKVGELLKNFAKRGSMDRAVQASLGIGLEDLSKEWSEAVRKEHLPQIAEYEKPEEYGYRLTDQGNDLSRLNLAPAVSPDGDLMVFLSDRSLYNDIYLASAIDGKVMKRLVEGERDASFESLRFLSAAMSWSPDQTMIAFAAKMGGEDAIYLLDVESAKVVKRLRFGFDGIQSPSFSPDGAKMVFVALEGGQSDLFIVDIESEELERLTDDRYADRDPHWSPDGSRIAFTTDRGPGTNFTTLDFDAFRIGIFDVETYQIRVLPFQEGKNISPQWSADGTKIAFVSDRTGISNIYITDLATNETFQLTNILTGVTGITETSPPMSWSANGDRMVFSVFNRGGWDVYAIKDPLELMKEQIQERPDILAQAEEGGLRWPQFGGPETLQNERGAGFLPGSESPSSRASDSGSDDPAASGSGSDATPAEAGDAPSGAGAPATDPAGKPGAEVAGEPDAEVAGEPDAEAPAELDAEAPAELDAEAPAELDAEAPAELDAEAPAEPQAEVPVPAEGADFRATGVVEPQPREGDKGGSRSDSTTVESADSEDEELIDVHYRPPAPDGDTFKLRDYKIDFSPDMLVGAGAFAPGIGAAGQFALGLSDVLGNHHIQFVASVFGDIRDSDVFVTYLNLERRNNWGVSVFQFRNDYLSFRENAILRVDREMWRGAEVFLSRPFSKFRRVELSLQGVSIDRTKFDDGLDSSEGGGLGIDFEGRRFFVRPEVAHITDNVLFGITGPISGARTRVSFGTALGDLRFSTALADLRKYINIRQRYVFAFRLLGMTSFGQDPQTFRVGGPYTIRGYSFEEFAGHNVGILNAEFRFPMIEYLAFGWPLPLAFGGIRGVFFFDAGTAFDRHDEFRAFNNAGSTFVRLNDIRASYGMGARVNLGFLILRWDLAQRTDLSRNLGKAVSTLAIGADF